MFTPWLSYCKYTATEKIFLKRGVMKQIFYQGIAITGWYFKYEKLKIEKIWFIDYLIGP